MSVEGLPEIPHESKINENDSNEYDNIYRFLSHTGFLEIAKDDSSFSNWVNQQNFEDFNNNLIRLNGIILDTPIQQRSFATTPMKIAAGHGTEAFYHAPNLDDRQDLLNETFEATKNLPRKDAGLLLYVTLQAIHPFRDGNGRTGRLLFLLLASKEDQEINAEKIRDVIEHDTESKTGESRKRFEKKIRKFEDIATIVNSFFCKTILGDEFRNKYGKLFSGLQGGSIPTDIINSETVSPDLKKQLEEILGEITGDQFSFRDIILVKFLINHGLLNKYQYQEGQRKLRPTEILFKEDSEKGIYKFDGENLLHDLTNSNGRELLQLHREIKREFVKMLIKIIIYPDNYKLTPDISVRDYLLMENSPKIEEDRG